METESLLLFVVACLTLNMIPGPDVIYIVTHSMKGKVSDGLKATLGLGLGYLFHTFAACLGLSALIFSSALAFTIVKWLGALYLFYLGIRAIQCALKGKSKIVITDSQKRQHDIFKQGLIVSLLNPKVALFFLSFLPQFVNPDESSVSMQFLMLGVIFTCLATTCNALYAALGGLLFARPETQKYARLLEGFSGILLIGLAVKVATNQR
ncbi:LysE family translocator [Alteromonas gilva]|uniref:LysE family translocator n=1 Tax=Alteromonas gilva TaxID=2987522 RepID=A0ABT5L5H9_9ALTE|nr:LysE family translocator [Alteromonas gilva]MDC8831023.1 LysE family translocator [Alteromonas gilva]